MLAVTLGMDTVPACMIGLGLPARKEGLPNHRTTCDLHVKEMWQRTQHQGYCHLSEREAGPQSDQCQRDCFCTFYSLPVKATFQRHCWKQNDEVVKLQSEIRRNGREPPSLF